MTDDRYLRQALFAPIGEAGQDKIRNSSAVIIGCGALGTVIADNLCRAGVGRLRIVDRDFVDLTNLQRQTLFTEKDARERLPKAIAAARRLGEVNSETRLDPVVADVNPRNIETLIAGFSALLDATDNLETRFLINDACAKHGIPWVYGGAVGSTGMVLPIIPGRTACLRCVLEELPAAGSLPTCDSGGILNAASGAVACLQTAATLRILVGAEEGIGQLLCVDVWSGRFRAIAASRREDCPTCRAHRYDFLDGKGIPWTTALCGRNMVQIQPAEERVISLGALAEKLRPLGRVSLTDFLLTCNVGDYELVVFPTGRVLVRGTTDIALARGLVARCIGT
jgi:adenylyltransferase/sulfurtransferase